MQLASSAKFLALNITNGDLINAFANQPTDCSPSNLCITEASGRIYGAYYCPPQYIFIYNPATKDFKYYQLKNSAIVLKDCTYNPISQRVLFGGGRDQNSYLLKATVKYDFGKHIDVAESDGISFLETSTFTLTQSTRLSISSSKIYNHTSSIDTPSTTNKVDLIGVEYKSDRYIDTDTQDLGLIPSCIRKTVALDLTCSLSGFTAISHILLSDPSSPPPNWVTLDASTGVVTLTTPNVTAATPFQFYVQSKVDGDSNTYVKLIKLTVAAYVYTKNQGTEKVNIAIYLTQAFMAIGAVLSIVTSILNLSSPQSLWMICNQFQLLLLLPLTDAFISEDVVNFFTGNNFINFNYNFVPIVDSPASSDFTDYFGNDQNNDSLQNLGAVYKRSILNHISLMTLIAFVVFMHAFSFVPKLCLKQANSDKFCYKAYSKWMRFLTFAVYVRLLVEALQAMFVSSLSELKDFSTVNTAHRLSLSFAFALLFVCIAVIVLMLVEWMRSSRPDIYKQQSYFVEIFGGLKDIWRCRSYLLLNFGRRAALITISIMCPFELIGVIIAFNVVQICYFGVMLWMRPFEAKTDGIINMSNELFFTILSLLIIHFNEESRWNQTISNVFMWTIFANFVITSLICFIAMIIQIRGIYLSKCKYQKTLKIHDESHINNVITDIPSTHVNHDHSTMNSNQVMPINESEIPPIQNPPEASIKSSSSMPRFNFSYMISEVDNSLINIPISEAQQE